MRSVIRFSEIVIAAVTLYAFAGSFACRREMPPKESEVVARVGDAVLTVSDLERMDRDQRQARLTTYLSKAELMDSWIQSELLYQDALKKKIDKEKECAWRLYNATKAIVIQRYWELEVYEKYPGCSEAEALQWYEKVKDKEFKTKEEAVWVRRVLVYTKDKADEIIKRVRAGEDFKAIASKESASPEKLLAGSEGYRSLDNINPVYRDVVAKMKPGEVAGPFKIGPMYAVIKLEDRVPPGGYLKPEGIGMDRLRDRAKVERWRAEADRRGRELLAKAKVERHPERIREPAVEMLPEKTAGKKPGSK